ncbi:MAG: TonB-dependent receptor [Marinicaulis sp.]|nr:TonB-dependent receptor [Marinicaulis sp.]
MVKLRLYILFKAIVALTALLIAPAPALAMHDPDGEAFDVDLKAGELSEALQRFSRESGMAIIFNHALVEGRKSRAVKGRYTCGEVLSLMLDGMGLDYKSIDENTWVITESNQRIKSALAPEKIEKQYAPSQDEIIVTANYLMPFQSAGARALYDLDEEQLRLSGAINVSEPIYELPASVSSVTSANTALLLSSGGLNLADLRGLGPLRTLVLVNGRRYVRTSGGNGSVFGVDLNSMPAAFIERIEIVNQGAGASIGLEAVAGAVNIVTRNELDGAVITASGGVSERGDAEEYSVSILAGRRFLEDRAHFMAGVTFTSEPSLLLQERPEYGIPYGFGNDGRVSNATEGEFLPGFGGSSITPNGLLAGVVGVDNSVRLFGPSSDAVAFMADGLSFEPVERRLDQLYNWMTDFSALPELDRTIAYAAGEFEISPNHKFYSEVHFANSNVGTQVASSPVGVFNGHNRFYGDAIFVPADNPFIPAGLLELASGNIGGGDVAGVLVSRRFTELGPRRRDINRETFQVLGGFSGQLSDSWTYDIFYQFGENKTRDRAIGPAHSERLSIALDVDRCGATSGCSPINIFGSTNITPTQADFIRAAPRLRRLRTREQVAQAEISGVLYDLADHSAGLNLGVEHHRERLTDIFEPRAEGGFGLGEFDFAGSDANVAFTDFFAGANLPLLAEKPGAQLLEIAGAYRWTKRHDASGFSNIGANLRWSPMNGIELYGQAFRGGRAPTNVELSFSGADTLQLYFDPCAEMSTTASINVIENCMSDGPLGVSSGFEQEQLYQLILQRGNPALAEEKIHSELFGGSIEIDALLGREIGSMRVSADWRRQRVSDAINTIGGSESLFRCYTSENFSDRICGENPATGELFIQRDPLTQQVISTGGTPINNGRLRSSGLDARIQYVLELDGAPLVDIFALDVLYTYIHRVRRLDEYLGTITEFEGNHDYPRHQIHATATLSTDTLKTIWTVRRRGAAFSAGRTDVPEARLPAKTYLDFVLQARPEDNIIVYGGVDNVFDTKIPIVPYARNGLYSEYYDPVGRRFFAGIKAEF